jgi:hypothetical protein
MAADDTFVTPRFALRELMPASSGVSGVRSISMSICGAKRCRGSESTVPCQRYNAWFSHRLTPYPPRNLTACSTIGAALLASRTASDSTKTSGAFP